MSCAKTAEPIEVPFGIWTRVGPSGHVLCGAAHWRHLANAIEPSVCGGDATCCQTTLTTLLHTHTPQPFYGPFRGPPRWAGARRELLDFIVQGKIKRQTHRPAGWAPLHPD